MQAHFGTWACPSTTPQAHGPIFFLRLQGRKAATGQSVRLGHHHGACLGIPFATAVSVGPQVSSIGPAFSAARRISCLAGADWVPSRSHLWRAHCLPARALTDDRAVRLPRVRAGARPALCPCDLSTASTLQLPGLARALAAAAVGHTPFAVRGSRAARRDATSACFLALSDLRLA